MGYGYYMMDGRPSGYLVQATCDRRDCNVEIDRGLGWKCGQAEDGRGCGLYFCAAHLGWAGPRGGCPHRGGPWGRNLSCMAESPDRTIVCCDRAGHETPHAWAVTVAPSQASTGETP